MKAPKHKQVGTKPSPDNKHGARIQALTVLDGEEAPQRTVRLKGINHGLWLLTVHRWMDGNMDKLYFIWNMLQCKFNLFTSFLLKQCKVKIKESGRAMMVHAFSPGTCEPEAGESL